MYDSPRSDGLRAGRFPEHDGRDDRVLRASGGEDALLQMDSVDPVTSEDFVGAGFEDSSDAVEVAVALHASQGNMGLPGASLRRKAKGLERGFEVRGDPTDGLGAPDADPDHLHPRETRERSGSSNGDLERLDVRACLTNRRHDFGDQALLGVAQELHREVKLVRGDDLERRARGAELFRKTVERGRRGNVHRDETSEGHGGSPPDFGPGVSATNRPRLSKRPRRWPSRTAVRRILVATSPVTESSVARSLTSSVPRAVAYAAAWANARSRALSRRAYARKYRPGTRKTSVHRVAAATLMTCCRTAPAAARTAPTPARARETVARRSYHIRRFMRRPPLN